MVEEEIRNEEEEATIEFDDNASGFLDLMSLFSIASFNPFWSNFAKINITLGINLRNVKLDIKSADFN